MVVVKLFLSKGIVFGRDMVYYSFFCTILPNNALIIREFESTGTTVDTESRYFYCSHNR
jgi:hypothetical protein